MVNIVTNVILLRNRLSRLLRLFDLDYLYEVPEENKSENYGLFYENDLNS